MEDLLKNYDNLYILNSYFNVLVELHLDVFQGSAGGWI